MTDLLSIDELAVGYGDVMAVFDASLTVRSGEIVTLLGPNGAGKTTILMTIGGMLSPKRGQIRLNGVDPRRMAPFARARAGCAYVPDDRALLPGLTVAENLSLVRKPVVDPYEMFPELFRLKAQPAGLLSGGEQQMLALARALCTRPKLLLIDELSLGLAPIVVGRLLAVLRTAADDFGTGVLLVEQHVERALAVADRGYVLVRGRIRLAGSAGDLLAQRGLVEGSYLGDREPVHQSRGA